MNMVDNPHHEHLIKEIERQLEPILSNSPQAIYIYLDDTHKICNKKFSDMLGYSSIQEWVDNQYPVDDVLDTDQDKGIQAYMDASRKFIASSLPATWKKKDGGKIQSTVMFVPFTYKDEVFVIHFVTPEYN